MLINETIKFICFIISSSINAYEYLIFVELYIHQKKNYKIV